jgi:hypothetical protein
LNTQDFGEGIFLLVFAFFKLSDRPTHYTLSINICHGYTHDAINVARANPRKHTHTHTHTQREWHPSEKYLVFHAYQSIYGWIFVGVSMARCRFIYLSISRRSCRFHKDQPCHPHSSIVSLCSFAPLLFALSTPRRFCLHEWPGMDESIIERPEQFDLDHRTVKRGHMGRNIGKRNAFLNNVAIASTCRVPDDLALVPHGLIAPCIQR